MASCAQCGAPLQAGTRFCGHCGAATAGPAPPPGGHPSLPAPSTAPAAAAKDTRTAQTLLLVGAVVAVLLPLLLAMVFAALGSVFGTFVPFGAIPAALFGLFAVVFLVMGLLWAFGAWYARGLLQQGRVERGAIIALIVGILMVVTGNLIAGLLVLGGGVLAYVAK